MPSPSNINELPLVVQYAAGIVTVLLSVFLMVWAAKTRSPPGYEAGNGRFFLAMNERESAQLLLSSQTLILNELKSINGNVESSLANQRQLIDALQSNGEAMRRLTRLFEDDLSRRRR